VSASVAAAQATAYAPGSVGNVGPGFDVLGLAVDGIGDRVTVAWAEGQAEDTVEVRGRDAHLLPADAGRNCAAIAARALLAARGRAGAVHVTIEKGLALAGGMGGSAASSVAGAGAAHLLLAAEAGAAALADEKLADEKLGGEALAAVLAAAAAGEAAVSGEHLDNVAASLLGGLALVRHHAPPDVVALPVGAPWWVALVTPRVRIETRAARALLPPVLERAAWVQQMANTAALVHAFAAGDAGLVARALDDRFAEPPRAALIPRFAAVKAAALAAGALGCSISGAGPTVFALAADEMEARRCAAAMQAAFAETASDAHVGAIARQGVRAA